MENNLRARVLQEVQNRLNKGYGTARFELKRNHNIVTITRRASGKYFVEVNEVTIHRNADIKSVIDLLIGG